MRKLQLRKTTWKFEEERYPCGSPDFTFVTAVVCDNTRVPPKGTLIKQVQSHPWFVIIWEPLTTKIPGPHLTRPWCCYARTVIFYVRGYLVRSFGTIYKGGFGNRYKYQKPGSAFEEWCRCEHTFRGDDIIAFNGENFEVGVGRVVYYKKRWWVRYSARRKQLNLK